MNLIDRQGKIMHCFKYNLAKHFAPDCTSFSPRNDVNTVVDSDLVHFLLFNVDSHHLTLVNDSDIKISYLVKETLGQAVLVSAYSQTVAGEIWFNILWYTK